RRRAEAAPAPGPRPSKPHRTRAATVASRVALKNRLAFLAFRLGPPSGDPLVSKGRGQWRRIMMRAWMSIATSISERSRTRASSAQTMGHRTRVATALELLLVYSGILLYIWQWQITHPRAWLALLAVVLLSHVAHGDTARDLGLTSVELRANAETLLPIVAAVYLP